MGQVETEEENMEKKRRLDVKDRVRLFLEGIHMLVRAIKMGGTRYSDVLCRELNEIDRSGKEKPLFRGIGTEMYPVVTCCIKSERIMRLLKMFNVEDKKSVTVHIEAYIYPEMVKNVVDPRVRTLMFELDIDEPTRHGRLRPRIMKMNVKSFIVIAEFIRWLIDEGMYDEFINSLVDAVGECEEPVEEVDDEGDEERREVRQSRIDEYT